MFETLELQYLNKLVKGNQVRDFASPKPFHTLKVERLGSDTVKPSAKVGCKFPVPIFALVGNFTVKPCQFSQSAPPIARAFDFARQAFAKGAKFVQGRFEGLRMLYLLTGVQRQIRLHTEVCSYTFTRSGQHFFGGVIRDDVEPKRSNAIPTDLDIADVPLPIAMGVIQDIATLEHKLLFVRTPFLKGQAVPLGTSEDFPSRSSSKILYPVWNFAERLRPLRLNFGGPTRRPR